MPKYQMIKTITDDIIIKKLCEIEEFRKWKSINWPSGTEPG